MNSMMLLLISAVVTICCAYPKDVSNTTSRPAPQGSCCCGEGHPGLPRLTGMPGRDGRDGLPGPQGPPGLSATPGTPGAPGRDGRDGEKGEKGIIGQTGRGPPGPSGGGVAYTRWGRTTCPTVSGTTLVYEGLAAGSHFNHYGGGANVICLVKNPKYNSGTTTDNHNYGELYGSEYQVHGRQALNSGLRNDHNIPCAVCHVSTRSSQIMVPGTYQCPSGWAPEYSGWLMVGRFAHRGRNMFTCIDKGAEVVPGQQANNDGNLFYHVEASCTTGIPCPPYDARKEMSCVVCTK